jgi:hypothetical protein
MGFFLNIEFTNPLVWVQFDIASPPIDVLRSSWLPREICEIQKNMPLI